MNSSAAPEGSKGTRLIFCNNGGHLGPLNANSEACLEGVVTCIGLQVRLTRLWDSDLCQAHAADEYWMDETTT